MRKTAAAAFLTSAIAASALAQTPAPPTLFDEAVKQEVIGKIGAALADRYIFPDRADQAKTKIDAQLAAGAYDGISEPAAFAARLTDDLQSVTHDKHMRVSYQGGPPPAPPQGAAAPPPPEKTNGGFARVDRLKGNIGYIKVNAFPPPSIFNAAADDAMKQLAGTDALIFDMRDNGGGSPETVAYLVSFLLDPAKRVHINSIVNRKQGTSEFTTEEFWSKPIAPPYLNKPVYVLASKRTFSGGEEFVYDVQALKRVSIYGETTGGGANPGGGVNVGPRFGIFIPGGRAENPITKTNWEGVGVVPDHPVEAKLAFQAALSDAVTKLLQTKKNNAALLAVKADLVTKTEPSAFVEAALLKFRTTPNPGTEAALRALLDSFVKGDTSYPMLTAQFANLVRTQPPPFKDWGAFKSVSFDSVGGMGEDVFVAQYEKGKVNWGVLPLEDGKIGGLFFGPLH
jgi:hypothetical protein